MHRLNAAGQAPPLNVASTPGFSRSHPLLADIYRLGGLEAMPCDGRHCPFVNRPDRRCAKHLSLDHLRHSFAYCFGRYQSCPVYEQRLAERQNRRGKSHWLKPMLETGVQAFALTIHATSRQPPHAAPPPLPQRPFFGVALAL